MQAQRSGVSHGSDASSEIQGFNWKGDGKETVSEKHEETPSSPFEALGFRGCMGLRNL